MSSLFNLMSRGRRRFLPRVVVLTAVAAAIAHAISQTSPGTRLELSSIDARYHVRGHRPVPANVQIAEIDADTQRRLKHSPRRGELAAAIVALNHAGAKVIVVDVLLGTTQGEVAADDSALVAAVRQAGRRVVLGTAPEAQRGFERTLLPMSGVAAAGKPQLDAHTTRGDVAHITVGGGGATAASALFQQNDAGEVLGVHNDQEQYIDEFSTRLALPSMSFAAVATAVGHQRDWTSLDGVPALMRINYRAPTRQYSPDGFELHQFADLVQPGHDLSWVRGTTVLIGNTSLAAQDFHRTPFSNRMPGVEIHANAIATLQARDWLRVPPAWLSPAMGALLALLAFVVIAFVRLRIAAPLVVVLGAMWAGAIQYAFNHQLVLPAVAPLTDLAVAAVASITAWSLYEQRERLRVQGLFSRYLAPEVVDRLVASGDEPEVGGERREVTVLFSDVRGFTSMSEHADPADVVAQLNEYFREMVESVATFGGTLDKFIGDGMMAVFGAPLDDPDHADHAVQASLDMLVRLERLNVARASRGLAELGIGIGLCTGPVIVGNVGSPERRVDYTAIGDTVNLAARLESATKGSGTALLVSDSVVASARTMQFVARGAVIVKGRTQATQVFTEASLAVDLADSAADDDADSGARDSPDDLTTSGEALTNS